MMIFLLLNILYFPKGTLSDDLQDLEIDPCLLPLKFKINCLRPRGHFYFPLLSLPGTPNRQLTSFPNQFQFYFLTWRAIFHTLRLHWNKFL